MGKITKSLPLGILGLVLFAYIGSKFPDIDQRTDVLTHRSILTHGLIVPVVFYLLSFKLKNSLIRSFVIVFLTGVAIHLCFDLFPKGWYMHALIHIPSIGWTPALVSKIWMFVSVVFCCYWLKLFAFEPYD